MKKIPFQVLLKWSEVHYGKEYWYVIRRTATGEGYAIEGYNQFETGKSVLPEMSFPIDQSFIEDEFKKHGKEWNRE